MSGSEKTQSKVGLLRWVIPALVLLVYLIVTLFSYSRVMKQQAQDRALERVSKQAVSVAGYYNGNFDIIVDVAEATANQFVDFEVELSSNDAFKILKNIKESLSLQEAYVVGRDSIGYDSAGKKYDEDDPRTMLYKDLLSSEVGVFIGQPPEESPLFVVSAPIKTEKEWLGNIVLVETPTKMPDLIEATTYSYYFVFSNGLVAEEFGAENNLFGVGDDLNEVMHNFTYVSGTEYSFKKAIEANRSGTICVLNDGQKQYITYQPVGNTGACVLVSVMENQIVKSAEFENKETNSLIFKIIIAIAIFVAIILTTYIANKVGYIRQNKELQNKAETDLLTDLFNKVSTENKIQEYLEGEGKDKVSMMCVLDIDNFKKINDTMGHAFGDEVLSSFGKKIRSEFRVTDIVGRIGGDEFVIFLKDVKDEAIIEREAKRIENFFKDFQVGSYTKYSPTASIGAAIYPRDGHDYESLYKAGDTALYKAKKRGKNQLAFFKESEN